ncbi:MAG: transglycosylase domain-containing protein [Antricoccus sp.]
MSSHAPSKFFALIKLVAVVAVGGLVVAGMLFPAVGGAGFAAKSVSTVVGNVDATFKERSPDGVTTVLAADGSVLTSYYNFYRVPIALASMGEWTPKAIVAIEDKRFYEHGAIDTTGTLRAAVQNLSSGGVSQGGSTITQQLVKNTLLYQAKTQAEQQAAVDQNVGRKVREAKIAIELEKKLTKQQILEKYLNLMYMGHGAYGVAAAAVTYFGVTADKLTIAQAAMITGMVQNPTKFDPFNNPKDAKARRDLVLSAMHDQKKITNQQFDDAVKEPIQLTAGNQPGRSCAEAPNNGGFFCDYLWTYLTQNLGIPESTLKNDTLTIKTTLNPSDQVAADSAITGASAALDRDPGIFGMSDSKVATMPILQAGTGKILALGINRKFGNNPNDPSQTTVNYPTVKNKGAGSTYKIFPTVVALQMGTGINYVTGANAPYTSKKFKNGTAPYTVENAGIYGKDLPLWKALYQSENTYFIGLEDYIGNMEPIVDTAMAMGLWAPGDIEQADEVKQDQSAAFTLGPLATNPLRLAVAYNTLASRGTKCEPVPVEDILGSDGKTLINPKTGKPYFAPNTNCTPNAIPQNIADSINQILLKDVMPGNSGQTGKRAYTGDGREIAGKSGTAESNFSYSFVGYTPQIVAAVLAFNPTSNEVMPAPGQGEEGFGGGYPAQMWNLAMQQILTNYPQQSFPPSDPKIDAGSSLMAPNCIGKTASACDALITGAGLTPQNSGQSIPSSQPKGAVASQTPGPGAKVSPGTIIAYSVSNG